MTAAEAFWRFSTGVYGGEGVKAACIALQDMHGLDVNVALWCIHVARQGRDPAARLADARAFSQGWGAMVVAPLRAARDGLKTQHFTGGDIGEDSRLALRRRVLDAELEAERLEQTALADLIEACPRDDRPPDVIAAAALRRYAGDPAAEPDLSNFLQSVFRAAEFD